MVIVVTVCVYVCVCRGIAKRKREPQSFYFCVCGRENYAATTFPSTPGPPVILGSQSCWLYFILGTSCLAEPVALATSIYTRDVLSDKGYKPPEAMAHCSALAEIPQPHPQWLPPLRKAWRGLFGFKEKRPKLAFYGRSWVSAELEPEARASGKTGAIVWGLEKSLLFKILRLLGK